MKRTRWIAGAAAFALGVLWPVMSQACPFCFSGSPRVRMAFFVTTIFLSLLPLGLIGAGVLWLFRSGRISLADDFEVSDFSAPKGGEGGAAKP